MVQVNIPSHNNLSSSTFFPSIMAQQQPLNKNSPCQQMPFVAADPAMPTSSSNNTYSNSHHQHSNSQSNSNQQQQQQQQPLPDNQTFIDCMSSMLKFMHQGYNDDPNLRGLLMPPAPVVTAAKPKRRRRKSRTLKLGEEEEEIIKQEEREEFRKVLESQFSPVSDIKPLPECEGTQYSIQEGGGDMEHLMSILLQYQSFKSYPFYTEDEKGQLEQIKLQKLRRHELMKQKRAIRRERRKEMKNKKRNVSDVDGSLENASKRTKSSDHHHHHHHHHHHQSNTNQTNSHNYSTELMGDDNESLWSIDYLSDEDFDDDEDSNYSLEDGSSEDGLLFSSNFLDNFDVNNIKTPRPLGGDGAKAAGVSPLMDFDFFLTPGSGQQKNQSQKAAVSSSFDSMFEHQLINQTRCK